MAVSPQSFRFSSQAIDPSRAAKELPPGGNH
jgi:hypothetical protein